MKKLTLLIIAIICLTAISLYAAKPTKFTGTWLLDESKLAPNENGMPSMEASKFEIAQDKNTITIRRNISNPMMGDFVITDSLTLDGKECLNNSNFGKKKCTAQWSNDKKELTINSTIFMNWEGQENEMKITEILSLENDNSVLKIQATRGTPMGEMKVIVYYNKSK
jgi:hypothetical protein